MLIHPQAVTSLPGSGTHSLEDVLRAIKANHTFLLVSHARPDGDSIGSLLAASLLLKHLGKQATVVCADRVPPLYTFLHGSETIEHRPAISPHEHYDLVLLLECDGAERTRLRGLDHRTLVNIDHHTSGRSFASINWIDPSASSVGEMIYRLARRARVPVTSAMATCLYTALVTDTGSFCYQSTGAHTFALAEDLVRHGADPAAIATRVYFTNPESKMRLLGAALTSLHIENQVAFITLTCDDMARSGSSDEDCEGLVNYAIGIDQVRVAVFLRETGPGSIRASLRSKQTPGCPAVNVAALAEHFGGGGHMHASGFGLAASLSAARQEILSYLRAVLPGCP
jgi:phosphoesterase RecJ-like protein